MQNPYRSPEVDTFRGAVNRTLSHRIIRVYLKVLTAGLLIVPLYNLMYWSRNFIVDVLLGANENLQPWLAQAPSVDLLACGLVFLIFIYAVIKEFH